jgi:hypothetical protein
MSNGKYHSKYLGKIWKLYLTEHKPALARNILFYIGDADNLKETIINTQFSMPAPGQ